PPCRYTAGCAATLGDEVSTRSAQRAQNRRTSTRRSPPTSLPNMMPPTPPIAARMSLPTRPGAGIGQPKPIFSNSALVGSERGSTGTGHRPREQADEVDSRGGGRRALEQLRREPRRGVGRELVQRRDHL